MHFTMELKRSVMIGIISLSFILVIISTLFFISTIRDARQFDPIELESMTKEQIIQEIYTRHTTQGGMYYYLIPIIAFFSMGIGAIIYYTLTGELIKKDEAIVYNAEIILKLLNAQERKVVQKIISFNGRIAQVEITYLEGFTKVKAHRIIESLVAKGIVTKETKGKMRMITLHPELYTMLSATKRNDKH